MAGCWETQRVGIGGGAGELKDRSQEQMNSRPFNNSASYRERARVLKQDLDALRRAVSPDVGGRDPATLYPRLPETSPWAGDPVGVDPALGRALVERRRSR